MIFVYVVETRQIHLIGLRHLPDLLVQTHLGHLMPRVGIELGKAALVIRAASHAQSGRGAESTHHKLTPGGVHQLISFNMFYQHVLSTCLALKCSVRITPEPSLTTTNWLAATLAIFSWRPLGQRISKSAAVASPRP